MTKKAKDLSPTELKVLTSTLLGEAVGEGTPGMTAVMNVINNRSNSGQYSSNPAAVAIQGSSGHHQFSAWDNLSSNSPMVAYGPNSPEYQQAQSIVIGVLNGDIPDNTGNALFYYANQGPNAISPPSWWGTESAYAAPTQIGHQIFASRLPVDNSTPTQVASRGNVQGMKPLPAPAPLVPSYGLVAGGTAVTAAGINGEGKLQTGTGLINHHVQLVPVDSQGNPILSSPIFQEHVQTGGQSSNVEDTTRQSTSDKLIDAGQLFVPEGAAVAARKGNTASWQDAMEALGIAPNAKVSINTSDYSTPPPTEFQQGNQKAIGDFLSQTLGLGPMISATSRGIEDILNPVPTLSASGSSGSGRSASGEAAPNTNATSWQTAVANMYRAAAPTVVQQPDRLVTVYKSMPNPAYRTKLGGDTQDHHAITNIQGGADDIRDGSVPQYISVPTTVHVKVPPKIVPAVQPVAQPGVQVLSNGMIYRPNNPSNFTPTSEAAYNSGQGSYVIPGGMELPTTDINGNKRNTYGDATSQGGLFQGNRGGGSFGV